MRHTLMLLVPGAVLLCGCTSSTGPGAHAGEPYVVNSQRTEFFSFGPAQSNGPDYALYHGQRVNMLSYSYGYSHIAIEGTGQMGYVPTEDLAPAPTAPQATPTPARSSGHRHHSAGSRPPTAAEQSTVPLPEFPESKPPPNAPTFRY